MSGVEWSGTDLAGGRGATTVGLHGPPLLLLRGSTSVIAEQQAAPQGKGGRKGRERRGGDETETGETDADRPSPGSQRGPSTTTRPPGGANGPPSTQGKGAARPAKRAPAPRHCHLAALTAPLPRRERGLPVQLGTCVHNLAGLTAPRPSGRERPAQPCKPSGNRSHPAGPIAPRPQGGLPVQPGKHSGEGRQSGGATPPPPKRGQPVRQSKPHH